MTNNLPLFQEIWKLLKPSIEMGDVEHAADTLVHHLIDEEYTPASIREAFKERVINEALAFFEETPEEANFIEPISISRSMDFEDPDDYWYSDEDDTFDEDEYHDSEY